MDCSPTRLLHPWDFPGNSTGVGCHSLLQGTFPTQGSNPGLLHYRQTPYRLSHQGSLQSCILTFIISVSKPKGSFRISKAVERLSITNCVSVAMLFRPSQMRPGSRTPDWTGWSPWTWVLFKLSVV